MYLKDTDATVNLFKAVFLNQLNNDPEIEYKSIVWPYIIIIIIIRCHQTKKHEKLKKKKKTHYVFHCFSYAKLWRNLVRAKSFKLNEEISHRT